MEEKKCHDVIEGLLNVNTEKIQSNRKESETVYTESYNFSGTLRKPILSLMMWGPATNLRVKQAQQKCDLDNSYSYSGLHVCGNFSEKHYWMYSHGDKVSCNSGSIEKLCGPVMTRDMKVIYPCNKSACNQDCLCPFCQLSTECLTENHKKHIRDFDQECHVQRDSQCQEHWVKHPETFNAKEDVMVEKNIFYHNEVLVKNPRIYFVEKLEFAGIPQKCITCCQNVETHLKEHKVIHLQCKFCLHQLRTAFDKKYWDKVCSICGKILPDISTRQMYWHKKIHNRDWSCGDCGISFNRKGNLRRHLMEIHGLRLHEIDIEDEIEDRDDSGIQTKVREGEKRPEEPLICIFCDKEFTLQRYLDTHVQDVHQSCSFKCRICPLTFNQRRNLKRHEETVHGQQPKDFINTTGEKKSFSCSTCNERFTRQDNLDRHLLEHVVMTEKHTCGICGKHYTRKDKLKEHVSLFHMNKEAEFICQLCDKQFDRKHTLIRHEKTCVKPSLE